MYRLSRSMFCIGAAAIIGGCNAFSTPGTPSTLGNATRVDGPAAGDVASNGDLVYGSHSCGGLCVFSYPRLKQVGSVTIPSGTAGYLCSDAHGNVFVLPAGTSGGTIYEYAHGGTTPVATLSDSGPNAGTTRGCSVDSTTGNLAVTNNNPSYGSNVAVYAGASGSPTVYPTGPNITDTGGCGYDDAGNLYIVGADAGKKFSLGELPNGSNALTWLKGPRQVSDFGHVQWVGKRMYLESPSAAPKIYRVLIAGSKYKFGAITSFGRVHQFGQAWIYKNTVTAPFSNIRANFKQIGLWPFPAGGTRIASRSKLGYIQGVTISVGE
jgi:hypothetical protein